MFSQNIVQKGCLWCKPCLFGMYSRYCKPTLDFEEPSKMRLRLRTTSLGVQAFAVVQSKTLWNTHPSKRWHALFAITPSVTEILTMTAVSNTCQAVNVATYWKSKFWKRNLLANIINTLNNIDPSMPNATSRWYTDTLGKSFLLIYTLDALSKFTGVCQPIYDWRRWSYAGESSTSRPAPRVQAFRLKKRFVKFRPNVRVFLGV